VRGQILGKQNYTWLQNAGASLGAKINIAPGVEPVGFSVSGGGEPNAPLMLVGGTIVYDLPQGRVLKISHAEGR
jgi:hypothetical protein